HRPQGRLLPAQRPRPRPRPRGPSNRRLTSNTTMQGVSFQMPPGGQNSRAVDSGIGTVPEVVVGRSAVVARTPRERRLDPPTQVRPMRQKRKFTPTPADA